MMPEAGSSPAIVRPDAWSGADPTACEVCGKDSCEGHLPTAQETRGPTIVLRRARDIVTDPAPVEIVEGFAWADCLTVVAAESAAGKSFVMADIAAAVSDGVNWHGREVLAGSVVYFSFENDAWGLRIDALIRERYRRVEHLYVGRSNKPISPVVQRGGDEEPSEGERDLVRAITEHVNFLRANNLPSIVLVVVDTVRASLTGSEDASEHVSAYLRAVKRVMAHVPGAAGVLVHHAGWQDGEQKRKRERGSSAWRGNCDATVYLEAEAYNRETREARIILHTLKVRDGEKPPPLALIRRQVELPRMNRRGEPITTCVIEADRRSSAEREQDRTAKLDAADATVDRKVLAVIRDYPEATSISKLRPRVGLASDTVTASVSRLLRNRLVIEGARGKPYQLTETGLALLNGQ